MGHQVPDGDGLAPEFGEVCGDEVGYGEFTFFGEEERGETNDGLGHGVDLEDVVHFHGLVAGFEVSEADGVECGNLAVASDKSDDASRLAGVDELLHADGDAGEAGGVEAGSGVDEDGGGEEDRDASWHWGHVNSFGITADIIPTV